MGILEANARPEEILSLHFYTAVVQYVLPAWKTQHIWQRGPRELSCLPGRLLFVFLGVVTSADHRAFFRVVSLCAWGPLLDIGCVVATGFADLWLLRNRG
jgi:hypothetical protein